MAFDSATFTDQDPREAAEVLRGAADEIRRNPTSDPATMLAVADLLQTLSWMPSIAHPADLAAALKVARAYLGTHTPVTP